MNRPNIVFITCHDLGQHVGCYGRRTVSTPCIDELSSSGVRFHKSFCTSPLCSPSRSSLHTGRYSHANGVMGLTHNHFGWFLPEGEKHMARHLKEAGYETMLVGVQHLNKHPLSLGYDDHVPSDAARVMAEAASKFLRRTKGKGIPFYLEVGFHEPHRPYNWKGIQPDETKGVEIPPYLPEGPEAHADLSALQGAVRSLDEAVGVIHQTIRETGLEQDTWIIFTTDHGIAMPRAKGTLYDPGIETALLMKWPGAGISGGKVYNDMISNVDIVPTLLQGLGLPQPDNIQGNSFWPLLQNQEYRPRKAIFAEKNYHSYYEPMRCIRTDKYKLIINMEVSTRVDVPGDIRQSPLYPVMIREFIKIRDHVELYDLDADPWEKNNAAGKPETADVEQYLMDELYQWMRDTDDPILKGPIPSPYYYDALSRLTKKQREPSPRI